MKVTHFWALKNSIRHIRAARIEGVPYDRVLQQLTRHRSFAYSVQSSRASSLPLDCRPEWSVATGKRMFDSKPASNLRAKLADAVFAYGRLQARITAAGLRLLGLHRQDWQTPLKPYATCTVMMVGPAWAWEHFYELRLHETVQPDVRKLAHLLSKADRDTDPVQTAVGCVYGPFIDNQLYVPDPDIPIEEWPIRLLRAIYRVSRTSTNKTTLPNDDVVRKAVARLYKDKHASPFEFFAIALPYGASGEGIYHGTPFLSLRDYLSL